MSEPQGKWAILGDKTDSFAIKSAESIKRESPFTTRINNGKIEFSLKYSIHNDSPLIQITKWYNSNNFRELGDSLPRIATKIREHKGFILSDSQILLLKKKLIQRKGYKKFEIVRRIVLFSHLTVLGKTFNTVIAKDFFENYPNGRIALLYASKNLNIALATIRVMGGALDIYNKDYEQLKPYGSFQMLSDIQTGVFSVGRYLTALLSLFLPSLYGFTASQVITSFLFILDNRINEIREPYPRSGLEFIKSDSSHLFKEGKDIPIEQLTSKLLDNFRLIEVKFSQPEIMNFIRQFVSKLNSCLAFLINPANFAYRNSGKWIGLLHYQAWMSFDRLADEFIFMLSDESDFLRKMGLFRILDQISGLAIRNPFKQSSFFKELLYPLEGEDIILKGLQEYKGAVGNFLIDCLNRARSEMVKTVINSIYVKERLDPNARGVKLSDSRRRVRSKHD